MSILTLFTKKCAITLLFLVLGNNLFAQYNFYKFSTGGGVGTTLTFADTKIMKSALALYGNFDYHLTPYISMGLEAQKGKLTGGENSRKFDNTYTTIAINTKIQLGEFLSRRNLENNFLNALKGLYGGVGIGMMKNNVLIGNADARMPNLDIIFQFSGGLNFYFLDKWGDSRYALNFGVQSTIGLEDGMDGDISPNSNFSDIYSYFSVGVKYSFGSLGLYRKK